MLAEPDHDHVAGPRPYPDADVTPAPPRLCPPRTQGGAEGVLPDSASDSPPLGSPTTIWSVFRGR